MKDLTFVDVNDGSCLKSIQIITPKDKNQQLGYGTAIEALGQLSLSPKGQLELKAEQIAVLGRYLYTNTSNNVPAKLFIIFVGECPLLKGYPFVPKQQHPPEYSREHLHLRPALSSVASMLRIRHNATNAFNQYLSQQGFIQIHTPIITGNDCEGGGEV